MKINIEKDFVEFIPEHDEEAASLEQLWRVVVDCVKFNKKLVPIGEYFPKKNKLARFAIES